MENRAVEYTFRRIIHKHWVFILSEASAKSFRPAFLAARAGAEVEGYAVVPYSVMAAMNRRSLAG
jgi:hypothetical protein